MDDFWRKSDEGDFFFSVEPYDAAVKWYSPDVDMEITWVAYVVDSTDGELLFEEMAWTADDAADMALGFLENEMGVTI